MSVATERKLVTVLFCDLVGSTALGERLDVEAFQSVQAAYFDRMRAVVERFGGTLEKFAGDAIVAVFGVPIQHEDDAERAVRCALGLREALVGLSDTLRPRFGVELELRIGVVTGEAMVGGEALATGDVMNTAARLEQGAEPGQILVGLETMQLTAEGVEYGDELALDAKGKREAVPAWPALRIASSRRRARSPLVGRARELEVLAGALERSIADAEPQAVVVLGEPGIGKSRLAEEFAQRAGGRAGVFRGACPPYGEGSTWLPLAGVVRQEAGIGDADGDEIARAKLRQALAPRHPPDEVPLVEAQLAPLAGTSTARAGSEPELVWAVRRYLERLAAAGPAVVVLDDLHWAEDALLDAVQELLQVIGGVPLTLVLQGRPELRDRIAELLADERAAVIRLDALSGDDAAELVEHLAGTLGADERAAIVERGGGSPLFLEEVAAMAAEDGIGTGVPRSLRALIGARLDLFPAEAKRVAQAGAVVGDVFWDGAVAGEASALRRLRTGGFVDEEPESAFLGQRQFRFHHALIREVTYESIPKLERAELHRRAADWLREHPGRPDLSVPVGRHLARAVSLRQEVAPLETVETATVREAVDALRNAAAWTAANADLRQATELLRAAVDIAGSEPDSAALAQAQLAAMLARSGSGDQAVGLAEHVLAGDPTREGAALAWLALAEAGRGRGDMNAVTEAATRALELAGELELRNVEVEAYDLLSLADIWSGRSHQALEHRRRATEVAQDLGDLPRVAFGLGGFGPVTLLEQGHPDEADRQAAEAFRLATETGSVRALEAAHAALALLRRAQDRLEESIEHGRQRVLLAEQLGEMLWLHNALTVNVARGLIDLGRLEEAWTSIERALRIVETTSVPADFGHALRVEILVARGQLDEAEAEIGLIQWPPPFAELASLRAAQGRHEEADEIWRGTLAGFAETEERLEPAEAAVGYARFLASVGRRDEARVQLDHAGELVAGRGARLVERLIREVEATL